MSPAAAGTAAAGHTAAKRTAGEASAATAESTATASYNHHRRHHYLGDAVGYLVTVAAATADVLLDTLPLTPLGGAYYDALTAHRAGARTASRTHRIA